MPVIAVLGNHDDEAGQPEEVNQILSAAGVHMLDGEACEIQGIGFAGVKGFGGGFGQASLQPWGENAIKRFVEEAIGEAVKLESALAKLRTPQRIAVLHYAPIRDPVAGEPAGASFCEHVARHSRNRRVSPIGVTHPRFYPSANGREAASVPAALAPEFLGSDHLLAR